MVGCSIGNGKVASLEADRSSIGKSIFASSLVLGVRRVRNSFKKRQCVEKYNTFSRT